MINVCSKFSIFRNNFFRIEKVAITFSILEKFFFQKWKLMCALKAHINKIHKTIYIKEKKMVTTVATVPHGTVATIQNWKEKMPHQNTVTDIVLAQCKYTECTVPKHCS